MICWVILFQKPVGTMNARVCFLRHKSWHSNSWELSSTTGVENPGVGQAWLRDTVIRTTLPTYRLYTGS